MDKKRIKAAIYVYEVKVTSIVAVGVQSRATKREILQKCRQEIVHYPLSAAEKNRLWVLVTKLYRLMITAARRNPNVDERGELVYAVLRKQIQMLEQVKNDLANDVELRLKHNELVNLLDNHENHFYYCTAHKDPAEGHAAYQGKYYFRQNLWDEFTRDEKKYVQKHGLLAVEDVVLEPVYLVTRRNCKHRLVPIPFDLLKRGVKKPFKDSSNISYAESQYRVYFDRLKLLEKLKKDGMVSKELDEDIKKTRALVRKWYNLWKQNPDAE